VVLRTRVVLLAREGVGIQPSAMRLGIRPHNGSQLSAALAREHRQPCRRTLGWMPRGPGAPATYSAEDACTIIALACEGPCDSGWAITHWTQRKLAAEAIKQTRHRPPRHRPRHFAALGWAHFKKWSR